MVALSTILLLTGCAGLGSLTKAVKQPNDLYVLTPKSTFSQSLPRIDQQVVVEELTATAAVDTDRIAVQPTPLQVQYLPQARWVDRAPLIVQALLIESFENSGKVAAVGRSTVGLRADYQIVTELREFQAHVVPGSGQPPTLQVDVRMNIKIIDTYEDHIIGSRSFQEYQISASDKAPELAAAFDEALGDAMRDAVEWSIRTMHSHASRNPRPSLN
ncbi:hypothetical protein FGK63_16585 [Ruegeria sediminis]|uniref:ABC-type transport auxiliary lipoprotein component domain-containing protein n=2 Tax=Ruegeria sediminis TaxID=2583820 RepID=A0ABY2WVI4_9RHOB|nr:hypothetical protein FGK63_16585 [Ruegeria sediminis]